MPKLYFQPSARLQRFLGSELIADPYLAVIEFVKNAYDAGATRVTIDLFVDGLPKEEQRLVISDNGTGMSLNEFEGNWMRPGFSAKVGKKRKVRRPGNATAAKVRDSRIPVGEKGLGRFAAGRLGGKMEVFTRGAKTKDWLHVLFDWDDFKDMETRLDKVPILYDHATTPDEPTFQKGTIVEIAELTLDWAGRVPGRKVLGRTDMRLGRLRDDLQVLVQPMAASREDFKIRLTCDSQALNNDFGGIISAGQPKATDYRYSFQIMQRKNKIVIRRKISRSEKIAGIVEKDQEETITQDITESDPESFEPEGRPSTLRCGDFKGVFHYSTSGQRLRSLGLPTGVFLYRDAIRVDPYGRHDNDWLGVKTRKAARQGHAAIQPNALYGFVELGRGENPDLIDMSNRKGLVENEAFDDFLAHARAEFRYFEGLVRDEYLATNWRRPEDKARQAAERTRSFGLVIIRAMLHSINNPITGLATEMSNFRRVLARVEILDEDKTKLTGVHRRSMKHLEEMEKTVDRFVHFDEDALTEAELFELDEAVEEAIERAQAMADSMEVEVSFDLRASTKVALQRLPLVEATYELIANAIQAERPKGRTPTVKVETSRSSESGNEIVISDNGSGFDTETQTSLGAKQVETKGRPPAGQILVRELLALFFTSYEVLESGSKGSRIRIWLPPVPKIPKK